MQPSPEHYVNLSRYDFLVIFIGVIIGLSVGHLVSFAGRFLSSDKPHKIAFAHKIYLVLLFFLQVHYWWTLWPEKVIGNTDFFTYIYLLALPLLMYVATSILCPESFERLDLFENYLSDRATKFYIVVALQGIFIWRQDPVNSIIRAAGFLLVLPAFFTPSKRFHIALSLTLLILFFVYIMNCSDLKR